MDTIIGLLIILLPVIFNLIGKKLEQSGHPDKAGRVRELAKALGSDEDTDDNPFKGFFEERTETEVVYDDDGQIVEVKPAVTDAESVQRTTTKPKKVAANPSVAPKKSVLLEDESSSKKREKIDPKKLVIYSEIMKPKF